MSFVRVSRVRRGDRGDWGEEETKRETTLNFGPRSKTTTGYEMRVRGREKEKDREEEETTRMTISPRAAAVRLGVACTFLIPFVGGSGVYSVCRGPTVFGR